MMDFKFLSLPTKEIYKDLFRPATKKAGEALSTVLDVSNLILLPLKLLTERSRVYFENNIKRYSEKLDSKDLTLTQVPQYIGLPILDKLTYLENNELSEAFINLLTKASFEESQNLTHPTFVSILNNLSADEAKILFAFKDKDRIPFIDIYIHKYAEKIKSPNNKNQAAKSIEEIKELIAYTFQDRQNTNFKYAWNLTGIEKEIDLMFPQNIDIYIENLHRNGLIYFETDFINSEDLTKYEELETETYQTLYKKLKIDLEEIKSSSEYSLEIKTFRKFAMFTQIGKSFLNACIKE